MLELSDIRVSRQGRDILTLGQLTLATNEMTVILGHNGSGKSTLMKLLARQLLPDEGQLKLRGQDFSAYSQRMLAREIAFLPQQLPVVAGMTVQDLVLQGRYPWRGLLSRLTVEDRSYAQEAMAQTDVLKYADQMTDLLSGGERQRAWVAMLLAQQSPLLLLDEPTSALDLSHQYELMSLLYELNRDTGRGVVVILHDINLAMRYADRVLALKQGVLACDGTPAQLLCEHTLSNLYGIDIRLCAHPGRDEVVAVVA
ncbi:MAG: ABC transporter ATP-binding protein [Oceanospirillales bacterium]|uniref:Iron complex transport system ATP-binding protein n=1 Tax=Marinobacterium halophilum TaxID=267374 RepID=A0A2P8EYT7_9GAMM|nr:ABC transporter ATP-binding protein [Marinobacterium halophilum]MBR9827259.1 ABC transporter ATP-binding protein [Oceanospirillales bacterium]PSL14633.1 iron complex transport system ATP-binding protein [Marinobacterium halophilum]